MITLDNNEAENTVAMRQQAVWEQVLAVLPGGQVVFAVNRLEAALEQLQRRNFELAQECETLNQKLADLKQAVEDFVEHSDADEGDFTAWISEEYCEAFCKLRQVLQNESARSV